MTQIGRAQLCTFEIADELFGLEIHRVQEVLRPQEMTRVSLAHPYIRGLINLRGQIVMAIDLRGCLGLDPLPDGRAGMNLVIRTDDGPVSFLVDRICDVVDLDDADFEPPPPNLPARPRRIIRGTQTLSGRLLSRLDADAVLSTIEPDAGRSPS